MDEIEFCFQKKKSELREEIERMLDEKGISLERRITVMNLDTRETSYFDDYPQALAFLKGKSGRWYLATPGLGRRDNIDKQHTHNP